MTVRVHSSWADRGRATSRLVRAVVDAIPTRRPEGLHALCRLTWIIKAKGEPADNTASVISPALNTLFGTEVYGETPGELARALKQAAAASDVVRAARADVGIVNFYRGFRNSSLPWLKRHQCDVWRAFALAYNAQSDREARRAYAIVADLPALPRPRAGNLPAYNLLTPVLACLDPRGRSPILNARRSVRWRLKQLGLANSTLVEQFDGLTGLIGQSGFADAFALDVSSDAEFLRAFKGTGAQKRPRVRPKQPSANQPSANTNSSRLREREDGDVAMLIAARSTKQTRLHNTITNALRTIAQRRKLVLEQGSTRACMFDALIRQYAGSERDLLVEVKPTWDRGTCRLAVGQLIDYRRQLATRAATDMAVLFPKKPSREALDLFGDQGIRVLWLSPDRRQVRGDVTL